MLAVVTLAGMSANGVMPASQVKADEALPGYVRSVYTNEWIPAEQSVVRPIAVMMPTDKVAQPSYGISNADILYEIMEEGEISRQMAVISNWTRTFQDWKCEKLPCILSSRSDRVGPNYHSFWWCILYARPNYSTGYQ